MSMMSCSLVPFLLLLLMLLKTADAAYYYATYVYVGSYYNYQTYYTGYVYYAPIGTIVGSVIGSLSFIGAVIFVLVCVCCVRRRRMMAAQRATTVSVPMQTSTTMVGAPIATVSGEAANYPMQGGYAGSAFPPPYPAAGATEWSHSNGYQPQQGAFYNGQQPYPQQQLPYPPPVYQNDVQAEQKF